MNIVFNLKTIYLVAFYGGKNMRRKSGICDGFTWEPIARRKLNNRAKKKFRVCDDFMWQPIALRLLISHNYPLQC